MQGNSISVIGAVYDITLLKEINSSTLHWMKSEVGEDVLMLVLNIFFTILFRVRSSSQNMVMVASAAGGSWNELSGKTLKNMAPISERTQCTQNR